MVPLTFLTNHWKLGAFHSLVEPFLMRNGVLGELLLILDQSALLDLLLNPHFQLLVEGLFAQKLLLKLVLLDFVFGGSEV